MRRIHQVRKRDGRLVTFERSKIAEAIFRAARAVGGEDRFLAEELAGVVTMHLERVGLPIPTIEDVQDAVERVLIETGHARTAKAYILYRERRATARALRRAADGGARPLLGGDDEDDAPTAWTKGEIADLLVQVDGLGRTEAEDVARSVEERVLARGHPRLSRRLLLALVQAELFDRGLQSRLAAPPRVGVRPAEVKAWLEGGPEARRTENPEMFARALGERVLESWTLDQLLPRSVAEAHRLGDLSLYDLGAPLALTSLALPLGRLLERHLHGEDAVHASAPRRVAGALAEILRRYRPYAARVLAVEDLNVWLAPFVAHLDEDALAQEVRELLLGPGFADFPARGGLLELEVGLAAEVPTRLAARPVPAPAPPGRTFGDYADVAREVGRTLLREAVLLRRRGWVRGPRFNLVLPREGPQDAAARAFWREAVATAAEIGDPLLVLESPGGPTRGSRWFRLREDEAPDPLRFGDGDVSAATLTAVNGVAAVLRTPGSGDEGVRAELDRLVRLALDGAMARQALLAQSGDEPGRTLYALRRGPVPLVDVDAAFHLVEPVGLERAARLLLPAADPASVLVLAGELHDHLVDRVEAEAAARGLAARVVEGQGAEAALRLARLDAVRFPVAARWWGEGEIPSYALAPPALGEARREAAWIDRRGGGARSFQRVRHRIRADERPAVGDLVAALEAAAHDTCVVEYALEPWPHRLVRGRT